MVNVQVVPDVVTSTDEIKRKIFFFIFFFEQIYKILIVYTNSFCNVLISFSIVLSMYKQVI